MAVKFNKVLSFKDYYAILFKHKLLLLLAVASFTVPTWYIRSNVPDTYMTFSQLSMEKEETETILFASSINQKSIGYYQGIFQGRAFLDLMLNSVDTAMVPGESLEQKQKYVRDRLSVIPGTFNSFLKIQCRTHSPELSYQLVRTATDSLIIFCRNMENQESERIITAIREHLEATAEAYNRLLDEKNQITSTANQGDIRGLRALENAFEELLVDYELNNADFQSQKSYFSSLDEQVTRTMPLTNKLRTKLQKDLVALMEEKTKRSRLNLPADSLNRSIESLEKEIKEISKKEVQASRDFGLINKWKTSKSEVSTAEGELDYKKTKIKALKKAIAQYKEEHPNIIRNELELTRLTERLSRYTDTHKRLTIRLEEELIKSQAQTAGLRIVEPPHLQKESVPRNDMIFYIIAALTGLLAGIGLALFREFSDDSIKTPDDIEKHLAYPVLGTIPHIVTRKTDLMIKRSTTTKKSGDLAFRYPELILKGGSDEGIIAEAYRSLRTNLLFASPDKPLHTFIITSSGPHEGKSLTAANVALAFGFQGDPTLIVDTDLRRPICHHLFNLERGPGLGDLFAGTFSIDDVVQHPENSPLNVITAGTFLPNAAEALGSKRFQKIFEELKERYRYIIFDTPPIIAVTDACILSVKVDGVALVTRAEKSSLQLVSRSLELLKKVNSNIFGCILNDVNLGKNSGYYGYYKKYYHYYRTSKE